jgi:hypothetical protein
MFLPNSRVIAIEGGKIQILPSGNYAEDYRGGIAGGVSSGGGLSETDPVWTAEKENYYEKTEINSTQLEDQNGVLGVKTSWLISLINSFGFINSDNVAYENETNTFTEKQNFEGGINLEENATISRSDADSRMWIDETGNFNFMN